MHAIRLFASRHSRAFQRLYQVFERLMIRSDPFFRWVGYNRIERPVAFVERLVKGVLFDCKMCGQCVLSSTGMSCPMNCPKTLRNGPCGGVRSGGYCEVKPSMKCVWVLAWDGAERMEHGNHRIREVLPPVDHTLQGSSAWLRVAREKAANLREAREAGRTAIAKAFSQARENEPSAAPLAPEPGSSHDVNQRK